MKKKNLYIEIGHPAHVSVSREDAKWILNMIWQYGYIDDHDDTKHPGQGLFDLEGIGIWTNYRVIQIIPIYKTSFSCNPFYVDKDGTIHLDSCSCGGTVIGGNIDRFNHEMSPNNKEVHCSTGEHIDVFTREGWYKVKESPLIKSFLNI